MTFSDRQQSKDSDSESDFFNSEDGLLIIILGIQHPVAAREEDSGSTVVTSLMMHLSVL